MRTSSLSVLKTIYSGNFLVNLIYLATLKIAKQKVDLQYGGGEEASERPHMLIILDFLVIEITPSKRRYQHTCSSVNLPSEVSSGVYHNNSIKHLHRDLSLLPARGKPSGRQVRVSTAFLALNFSVPIRIVKQKAQHQLTNTLHLTLKMTSAQVCRKSLTTVLFGTTPRFTRTIALDELL